MLYRYAFSSTSVINATGTIAASLPPVASDTVPWTVALGLEGMADDRRFSINVERVKHRKKLEAIVSEAITRHDREPLLKLLDEAGVPATPANTVDQVLDDPQTASRSVIRPMQHPKLGELPVVGMPVSFSRMQPDVRRHAPARGEHTDEVLTELGYSPNAIADLRARKVIM